jgi:methionyl-tRNA synthetase
MSRFYVTTPIYYVNDKPHLGHAYTTLCADVLARWHRLRGEDVFFLTGTDEHGVKVQQSAEAAGLSPLEFAGQNAQKFKDAWAALNISHDYFIRTSQPEHEAVVKTLLQKVYDAGYIYQGEYEGLYCVGCEKFLQTADLVNDKCPLHPNQAPVAQKETNYFFKLSAFKDKLLAKLESGEYKIIPAGRHNEVVGKLKQGLEDISISRNSVEWGVRVPWDESQTIYVWIDALINYYSATQFVEGKKDFWPAEVHLLAKDILWFHAVIWEALLLAADLELPKTIATHGFFTIDGQKMSKSLGNVIDPNELVKEFGLEATRYLLMSQVPFTIDGDVSLARFRERYESDLANGLGNTFSRVTNMAEKFGVDINGQGVKYLADNVEREIKNFSFDNALAEVIGALREIDREIDIAKPWIMMKGAESAKVPALVGNWVLALRQITLQLKPFMSQTAETMEKALLADKIVKAEPLFPRFNNK